MSWILTSNKDAQWKPRETTGEKRGEMHRKSVWSAGIKIFFSLSLPYFLLLKKSQFRQHSGKPAIKESRISKDVTHPDSARCLDWAI